MRLDPSLVPADVAAVLRALHGAGKQAYLAGGAVRDLASLALGRPARAPQDFDVATDALPEQVAKLFPKVIPTGIQHGTVTVLSGEHKVEVTTFRGEGAYHDGRRPSSVTFLGDIDGDLARRDFTVNAIAWDPLRGDLRDPFHGVGDLQRCRLRAVGDALERFREDGLRPLRAVRFACTLRLAIVPSTLRAIPQALDTFAKVATERVRDELQKMLLQGHPPSRGLRLLLRTGLLAKIIPELLESVGFAQNRYHAYDVWRHTLRAVDFAPPEVRWATLLHDVAKPRCAAPKEGAPGENTFYEHERIGAALTEEILLRLKLPRRDAGHAALLVREHNWHYQPEWNDATVRRTIARIGPQALPDLWKLRRADLSARGRLVAEGLANQAALEERFDAELRRAAALKISDLTVSGRDLMTAFGLRPGPVVGSLLSMLLEKVIDDPQLNTRETLLRLASERLQKLSTGNPQ